MLWVEGIKHKNSVPPAKSLLLRRSFCADLYRCASGPILSSAILFLKVVCTEVFHLCVLISSLSVTLPENETTCVAVLTVRNTELQPWV